MSRGVELPWHILGRRIRPFSFALMLATIVVAIQFFALPSAPGDGFAIQHFSGSLALMGAFALLFGWVGKSDPLHDFGLLVVAGVWMGRTALYLMQGDLEQVGLWLSVCWLIAAVGAWFIERYDHKWQHVVAERRDRRLGDAHG